jgi:hypothetical protein
MNGWEGRKEGREELANACVSGRMEWAERAAGGSLARAGLRAGLGGLRVREVRPWSCTAAAGAHIFLLSSDIASLSCPAFRT